MAIANANDKPITVTLEPPASTAAAALIRNAVHQHLAAGNLEAVCWFCSHPETPEDVLLELCVRGVCLDELGHRNGPRKLLEKLAEEHRYPEAVLTLALALFEDSAEPAAAFATFLKRYLDNDWLLETLARRGAASSGEKEEVFIAAIAGHPREKEFCAMRESRISSQWAAETRDAAEMERLFAAGDPQVWRGLASNRAAPRELLDKLAAVEGVKNAREIRNLAVQNLRSR